MLRRAGPLARFVFRSLSAREDKGKRRNAATTITPYSLRALRLELCSAKDGPGVLHLQQRKQAIATHDLEVLER